MPDTTTAPPTDQHELAPIPEKPKSLQEAKNRGAGVPMVRSGGGYMPAFSDAGQVMEFAAAMAGANIMVGPACRGNVGACMAVTLMAGRFGLDPFMLSHKAYITTSKSGVEIQAWEAQAIYAMLLGSGELQETLDFDYDGTGQDRRVTVTGRLRGKSRDQTITTSPIKDIAVKNSPLWKGEPDQQLAYYGSRLWARRHAPHILMGVYSREEADEIIDVTPPREDPGARLIRSLEANSAKTPDAKDIQDAEIADDADDSQPVAAETGGEAGDEPAAEAEPSVQEIPPHPGELIRTKKGALEYAQTWAAYWKAIPKEMEQAFWDETEALQTACVGIDPKTEDVFNDAINAPKLPI